MTERRKDLVEFEARLREMSDDPTVRLFLGVIEGMSPESRDIALERQKKLMNAADVLGRALGSILRSEGGAERLREAAEKSPGDKS